MADASFEPYPDDGAADAYGDFERHERFDVSTHKIYSNYYNGRALPSSVMKAGHHQLAGGSQRGLSSKSTRSQRSQRVQVQSYGADSLRDKIRNPRRWEKDVPGLDSAVTPRAYFTLGLRRQAWRSRTEKEDKSRIRKGKKPTNTDAQEQGRIALKNDPQSTDDNNNDRSLGYKETWIFDWNATQEAELWTTMEKRYEVPHMRWILQGAV
ncbi:MAG: hypothetical protein Q9222_002195 [Ikaeria aurantiellina]